MQIQPLLGIEDIKIIFGLASNSSVYRWVSEARLGKSRFPLPINGTEGKRKLRWNRDEVEEFCRARTIPQPKVSVASTKRATKNATARREATRQSLAHHGINIDNQKGDK